MRVALTILAIFALVQPSASLAKQSKPLVGTPRDARIMMARFAECQVSKRPKLAREALAALNIETRESLLLKLSNPNNGCLFSGTLRMDEVLFGGDVAAAAYERDFDKGTAALLVQTDWALKPIAALDQNEGIGYCLVQADPMAVEALVLSETGSAEEGMAAAPVFAHLEHCIPAGLTIKVNAPYVRAVASMALYRATIHFLVPAASADNKSEIE
jgi:hypothetical protein